MTRSSLGVYNARLVANNHEWGIRILDPILNYYDGQYNSYIAMGFSENVASGKAFDKTIAYIPEFKYLNVLLCQNKLSTFNKFFGKSYIMDFTNNCAGRAAAGDSWSSNQWYEAFKSRMNNGEIVQAESKVNGDFRYRVWAWDWYAYSKPEYYGKNYK